MSDISRILGGHRLTTALIVYHWPDYDFMLQEYVWQEYDLVPRFPVLNNFLHFWQSKLDGRLHSVWVACAGIIAPRELRHFDGEFTLQ